MRNKIRHTLIFLLIVCIKGFSQITVSGSIIDKTGNPIPGAIIKVTSLDSVFVTGASTDTSGNYNITLNSNGKYILKFSYLGYSDLFKVIATTDAPLSLGKIVLKETAQTLSEVVVKTTQVRGEQKGDTTAFNSDSFKTNPDATAEDLIKKMPGITSDNTGIKVNGEAVQKVLVDGKPFFGDDPNAALRNLPSDIIDKVEVFDKMSDQSAFTGFNDGNQQKTINLVTKKGKNVGYFGKVFSGYGTDDRYNAGATINSFNDKRRVSLLLLSNNINQQNFSISDITGALGSSAQNSSRGGGPSGSSGSQPGGGGVSSLLTTPQNGNTTTQSAGLNYSDAWGKKIIISGSYFFNYGDNKNQSAIVRHYFTENGLVYNQNNNDRTVNQNHRANVRLEYNIDSANKIIWTPSVTYQNTNAKSALFASNNIGDRVLSNTNTNSNTNNIGYDFANSILYQHKFAKKGRTISLNVSTDVTEKDNNGSYVSTNNYGDSVATGLNQTFVTYSNSKKISGSLSYTEPLNKNAQIQINYSPSYTQGFSNKTTNDYDSLSHDYTHFDNALSNKYNNVYITEKGGLTYRYQKNKLNFSFGADVQQSTLTGQQTYPVAFAINKSFQNILPNAQLNYKFNKSKNLRIYYRSATNIPSLTQLQNVLNVSNPLQIQAGNTDLKQTFENNLSIRFGGFNTKTSRNAMLFVNASYIDNYISNATSVLKRDSLAQGYQIKAGSQITKPVNLNGYYTARGFFVYGFPVTAIKSNLNLNGGITYNHTPTLINDQLNLSDNYAFSGGAFIGSNISQKIDFSLGYNTAYNIVDNSIQKQANNNYITQATTFKINWIFFNGFVLNTDVTYTIYDGLSQNYNQDYFLWNAYFGYKFFKNKSLEAKVSVFDLLNQNRSIGRNITGTYTEDYNTLVLKRYFLFTLTYTFKKFKSGDQPKAEEDHNPMHNMPGMPPRQPGNRGGGY